MSNSSVQWKKRKAQGDFGTSGVVHELFENGERRAVLQYIPGWGWNVVAVVSDVEAAEGNVYRRSLPKVKSAVALKFTQRADTEGMNES